MEKHLKAVSENAAKMYKNRNGCMFSKILEMVYDEIFECNEEKEKRKTMEFGKGIRRS